jgi:uncharacterized membrane protein SpoIIM required for sporulation
MLESLINPKRVEKGSWKMFFIGLIYASLSLLLVHWFFKGDAVLSQFSGILVVTFCVMFSLPFFIYLIKVEEKQDEEIEGLLHVWRVHKDAIFAFIWLFLGFIIAFSFWNIIIQDSNLFNAQVQTYCRINNPGDVESCVQEYSFSGKMTSSGSTNMGRLFSIIENNVYVMIFTLIFSLIFGAGAIFILSWNASVIAAAIGIFTSFSAKHIPLGLLRYMIHGIPEITAYFITALAGGIFGVGAIRHGIKNRTFLRITENVIILLFVSIIILILAALLEVYITPFLFE